MTNQNERCARLRRLARELNETLDDLANAFRRAIPPIAELAQKLQPIPGGKWEAVPDPKGEMWRVRWSEPNQLGLYLYVRHYGGNGAAWNQQAAERNAKDFNEAGRIPQEFEPEFRQ